MAQLPSPDDLAVVEDCERALLTYFVDDDHGLKGLGHAEGEGPGGKACFPAGGPH